MKLGRQSTAEANNLGKTAGFPWRALVTVACIDLTGTPDDPAHAAWPLVLRAAPLNTTSMQLRSVG
ncbi:MAG: hypothetical protein ACREEP_04895, partial [Dongiaceae bacterium]